MIEDSYASLPGKLNFELIDQWQATLKIFISIGQVLNIILIKFVFELGTQRFTIFKTSRLVSRREYIKHRTNLIISFPHYYFYGKPLQKMHAAFRFQKING